jgi:anti-anti-sigma factor
MADDPDALLEIRTWRLGSLRILRLLGELDAFTAPRVRATLDEVMAARREPGLIVDLTQLTFMASAGVGLLLEIQQRVSERGERLVMILASKSRPRRLFDLTRMTDHFEVADNLREAVRALRQVERDSVLRGGIGETPQVPLPADRLRLEVDG